MDKNAHAVGKRHYRSKTLVFKRTAATLLTLLVLFLSGGCQGIPSTIDVTVETPPPAALTEVPPAFEERSIISVPQGRPIAIDGTMSPGEWDAAGVETFSDGGALFLMYNEGFLYLGIRGDSPEMIAANVFIDRGSEIAVLHASAALGTAIYAKGTGAWQRSQDFVWRCRRADDGEAATAEREAFLREERWLAANSRMGTPNEIEYQIEMTDETLRLAVNFVNASATDVKIHWPIDLDDDCVIPTPGGMPPQMDFDPDQWRTIGTSLPGR